MLKRFAPQIMLVLITVVLTTLFQPLGYLRTFAQQQPGCQTFKETGKTVCGNFLTYWQTHGGLAQQGFPISEPFNEKSDLNGQTYLVQYFERAVFEMHPENQPPYDVLLSQLGTFQFKAKYPAGAPGGGSPPTVQPQPTQPAATGGAKLEVIDYRSYKAQYSSYVTYVGIAKNTGGVQLGSVKISATFKDASGKIVDTGVDYGPTGMVPGDVWPFSISTDSAKGAASVQFQIEAEPISTYLKGTVYRDLKVAEVNITPPGQYDTGASVVGTVTNIGSGIANSIVVYVVAYDAAGKILDTDNTYAALSTLAPGQTSNFKATLSGAENPAKVEVFAYASKK